MGRVSGSKRAGAFPKTLVSFLKRRAGRRTDGAKGDKEASGCAHKSRPCRQIRTNLGGGVELMREEYLERSMCYPFAIDSRASQIKTQGIEK
jgi:hypothetical protein